MLLNERKIELLKELEHAERTPTELSERMNLTISSVNKHLKDLEKIGLVTKTGKKEGKTRSYWKYQLKEFIYFIASLDGEIQKKEIELNENQKTHLRIWSIPQPQFHKPLEKLWCKVQEDLEKIKAIAIYGSVAKGNAREDSDIDLLIITEQNQDELEDKYGAKVIGGKMFMAKTFSENNFKENLEKESKFSQNTLKESKILYDPQDLLYRWKNEYKRQTS